MLTICQCCDGLCERFDKLAEGQAGPKGFASGLIGALWYPFTGQGPFLLLGATLFQLATGMLGVFAMLLAVAGGACVAVLLRRIVLSSAEGEATFPGWPEIDMATAREAALQLLAVSAVSFGPWTLFRIWVQPDTDAAKLACGSLLALGACYFPIALLGVLIYDSLAALNPLLVLVSIVKVPLHYLATCLFVSALLGMQWFAEMALARAGTPLWAALASGAASLYLAVAALRAIGWFYYCTKDRLAWS